MFKRFKHIQSSKGKFYTYVYLVENQWIKGKGSRQRVIKYIGKVKGMQSFNVKEIFERDNYICQYCGSKNNLTIDHVIPSSRGGDNSKENLKTLCVKCNQKKGNKLMESLSKETIEPNKVI